MNAATIPWLQLQRPGYECVVITPYDPMLHVPTVAALRRNVHILMLSGTESDPRCPVHEYLSRAGVATVQGQDVLFRTLGVAGSG